MQRGFCWSCAYCNNPDQCLCLAVMFSFMKKALRYLLLLFHILFHSGIQAQEADALPLEQRELLRQREQRERESVRRFQEKTGRNVPSPPLKSAPKQPPIQPKRKGKCFPLREIKIEGDKQLSFAKRKSFSKGLIGRCVYLSEVHDVLVKITQYYVRRGFITTRAYFPSQNLRSGILRIQIVKGIVEKVSFAKQKKQGLRSEIFTAFPFMEGSWLHLRTIEQGLDQINRLSSNAATVHLYPGTRLGYTHIVIDKPYSKPWHAAFGIDNSGSEASGQSTWSADFTYDSLFALNDFLALGIQRNARDLSANNSHAESLRFVLPFGPLTGSVFLSRFAYKNSIHGNLSAFVYRGDSLQQLYSLTGLVHRSSASTTLLAVEGSRQQRRNYINNTLLLTSSVKTASLGAALLHNRRLGPGSFSSRLARHSGRLSYSGDTYDFRSPSAPRLFLKK